MGNCAWFEAVSGDRLSKEKDRRERERTCVAVLSGGDCSEEGELQCGCPHTLNYSLFMAIFT